MASLYARLRYIKLRPCTLFFLAVASRFLIVRLSPPASSAAGAGSAAGGVKKSTYRPRIVMEGEGGGGGVVVVGRAEIDTRAPFRSVKEAVMLFGERVLAGEVYAPKLNEMRGAAGSKKELIGPSRVTLAVAPDLEGTKQNLEKARESESLLMASNICALQEELQKTKKELQQLIKAREAEKTAIVQLDQCEIKDINSVENNAIKQQIEPETPTGGDERPDVDLKKRRYVKFANPPSALAQATTMETAPSRERQSSSTDHKIATPTKKEKQKKKPLIPALGRIFSKKKGRQEVASAPKAPGAH